MIDRVSYVDAIKYENKDSVVGPGKYTLNHSQLDMHVPRVDYKINKKERFEKLKKTNAPSAHSYKT